MPLVDAFGRSIVIIDREEHAKYWCRAKRREISARRAASEEQYTQEQREIDALERDVEQLEDELARVRRAS
jgi:hypothetical protein